MNKVQLSEVQRTLEAVNISGCIIIHLDEEPPIRLTFSQKLKVYFDIQDNSYASTSKHHLQDLARTEHSDISTVCEDNIYNSSAADSCVLDEDIKDSLFSSSSIDNANSDQGEESALSLSQSRAILENAVIKLEPDVHTFLDDSPHMLMPCDERSHDQTEICLCEESHSGREGCRKSSHCSSDFEKNKKCLSIGQTLEINENSVSETSRLKMSEKVSQSSSQVRNQPNISCTHCYMTFTSKARLAAHNRVLKCVKRCQKCGEDFLCSADLFRHQYRKYDADFMAQQYPSMSILKSFDCGKKQCPLCKSNFQSSSSVLRHLQAKHFSDESYACCVCGDTFRTSSLLKSHLKKCVLSDGTEGSVLMGEHYKKNKSSNKCQNDWRNGESPTNSNSFPANVVSDNDTTCEEIDQCRENTNASSKKEEHLSADSAEQCQPQSNDQNIDQQKFKNEDNMGELALPVTFHQNSCSSGVSSSSIERGVVSVTKKHIQLSDSSCSYCLRSFASFAEREAHHRVSDCIKECRKCKEEFLCEADLFVHQYRKHDVDVLEQQFPSFSISKETLYSECQCPLCNKHLPTKVIHHHIQEKHFSDKSYCCCVCKSGFKTSFCLNYHLRKHTCKIKRKLTASVRTEKTKSRSLSLKGQMSSHLLPNCAQIGDESITEAKKPVEGHCESPPLSKNNKCKKSPKRNEKSTERSDSEVKTYDCRHCGKVFSNQIERNNHKKVPPMEIKCPKCPRILASQTALIIHNFRAHDVQFREEMLQGNLSGVEKNVADLDEKYLSRCPLCWKTFLKLREHVSIFHTGEMLYQCCVCGKKFSSSGKLRRHCEDHSKERIGKFHCSKCPMVTNSHSDFFRHAATHRTQCVFCKVEFGHTHLLWPHYESQHADQLFTCKTCGKKIPTKAQLDAHVKHHRFTYVKPCPICGIMIKGNSVLERHLKRVHHRKQEEANCEKSAPKEDTEGDGNEKTTTDNQFLCSECPETLSSYRNLMQHLKSHNRVRVPCPTCSKTFTTKSNLTKHIDSVHLNITNHTCEICGKKATNGYNLRVHKRIHSATKLFFCTVCGQGFNYKASLQGHMKSKHKEEQA